MSGLGIESPTSRWFYWVDLAGAYALCDPTQPLNSIVRMTASQSEAAAWTDGQVA